MRTRLLDALAIVSLTCLFAVVGVDIASYRGVLQVFPKRTDRLLVICRGRAYLMQGESQSALFERADPHVDNRWHWTSVPIAESLMMKLEDPSIRLSGDIHHGFGVIRIVWFRLGIFTRSCTAYVASMWPAIVLFSLLPLLWMPRLPFHRRHRPGICAVCGYNLHATPTRCPECGTPAAPSAPAGDPPRITRFAPIAVTLLLIAAAGFTGRRALGRRRVDTGIDVLGGITQLYAIHQIAGSAGPLIIDQTIAPSPSRIIGAGPQDPDIDLEVPEAILTRLNPTAGSQLTARPQELVVDVGIVKPGPKGVWLTKNGIDEYSVGINNHREGWKWTLANDPPKFQDNTYDLTGTIIVDIYGDRTYKIRFVAMIHSVITVDPEWGKLAHPTGATVRWVGPE